MQPLLCKIESGPSRRLSSWLDVLAMKALGTVRGMAAHGVKNQPLSPRAREGCPAAHRHVIIRPTTRLMSAQPK